jgi:hypothetical protein
LTVICIIRPRDRGSDFGERFDSPVWRDTRSVR